MHAALGIVLFTARDRARSPGKKGFFRNNYMGLQKVPFARRGEAVRVHPCIPLTVLGPLGSDVAYIILACVLLASF